MQKMKTAGATDGAGLRFCVGVATSGAGAGAPAAPTLATGLHTSRRRRWDSSVRQTANGPCLSRLSCINELIEIHNRTGLPEGGSIQKLLLNSP